MRRAVANNVRGTFCGFVAGAHIQQSNGRAGVVLVPKGHPFGTTSSPRRDVLRGPQSGGLEGRFPPARLLLPGGRATVRKTGVVLRPLRQSGYFRPLGSS